MGFAVSPRGEKLPEKFQTVTPAESQWCRGILFYAQLISWSAWAAQLVNQRFWARRHCQIARPIIPMGHSGRQRHGCFIIGLFATADRKRKDAARRSVGRNFFMTSLAALHNHFFLQLRNPESLRG